MLAMGGLVGLTGLAGGRARITITMATATATATVMATVKVTVTVTALATAPGASKKIFEILSPETVSFLSS